MPNPLPSYIAALQMPAAPLNQQGVGLVVALTYAASLTPGAAVYVNSSGAVDKANATGVATAPCAGLALATASSGANLVLLSGLYRDDVLFNFGTLGGAVYLDTTAGLFSQTPPSATDNVIQVCGIAIAQRVLLVRISPGFITHT